MPIPVISNPLRDLARLGLNFTERSHYQLTADQLIRDCLRRTEGIMSDQDALVIRTGEFTGRSPKDRYLVQDENYAQNIDWNDFNQPLSEQHFDIIQRRLITYLNKLPEVWIRDCYACADMRYRLNIRVVNERPSSNLFAHNMFLRPSTEEIENNQ